MGALVEDVREVTSYEGFYSDLVSAGEEMVVRGKLERVEDNKSGEVYHRILVGSQEAQDTDYIKPAVWFSIGQ